MPRVLPLDHHCPWREEAEEFKERLTSLEGKMAALERHVFSKRAERLPTMAAELRADAAGAQSKAERDEAALRMRRERAARKAEECQTREV
ncbi:hypothetical protein [Corallococcus sp. M7]